MFIFYPQCQFLLLTELFDSKQPFYQKYGQAKPISSSVSTIAMSSGNSSKVNVSADHMKFLNELDVGSCFDYYHEGVWELAIIERLSEFRTEVEINLPERKYNTMLGFNVFFVFFLLLF